jgi:hypothetical protein
MIPSLIRLSALSVQLESMKAYWGVDPLVAYLSYMSGSSGQRVLSCQRDLPEHLP